MANNKERMCTIIKNNGTPLVNRKQNRNEHCRCGSGKKAKKCCGEQSQYFYSKKKDNS